MDLATMVLAGQPVGTLVQQGDSEDRQPEQDGRLPVQGVGEAAAQLPAMDPHQQHRHDDAAGREDQERPCPEEPDPWGQPGEQSVGIPEAPAPVEDARGHGCSRGTDAIPLAGCNRPWPRAARQTRRDHPRPRLAEPLGIAARMASGVCRPSSLRQQEVLRCAGGRTRPSTGP